MLERNKQYSKTGYLFKVATILMLANITFFFFYYQALSLRFSLITALIIVSVNVNFVLLLYIIRNMLVRILLAVAYLAIFFYTLINFAYYEVFQTFLRVSWQQTKSVNLPFVALLKDFYVLIPPYIYLLVAVIAASFTVLPLMYAKKFRKMITNDEINMNRFNFIKTKINIKSARTVLVIVSLIVLNSALVFFLHYYENSAMADDKGSAEMNSDLGPMGMLVDGATSDSATSEAKSEERLNVELKKKSAIELAIEKAQQLRTFSATTSPLVMNRASSTGQKFNVLVYQLESVPKWALELEPSPMPFLKSLSQKESTVDHFFPNSCMTINAEFSSLCSFYTDSYGPISDLYANNDFYCLPQILKEKHGYATTYNHANSSDFWNRTKLGPSWGFDKMNFMPYYESREYDGSVIKKVVNSMSESKSPSFNYVIGFTTHAPHNKKFADLLKKKGVKLNVYDDELGELALDVKTDEETLRSYLSFLGAVDQSIKIMFDELRKKELLDKTVVVLYGDHKLYGFKGVEDVEQFINYHEVPFLMHIPGFNGSLGNIASHVDVAPTILNIIEGSEYQAPEKFLGQSLISEHQPLAVNKCLGQSYFYTPTAVLKRDIIADKNYAFHYFDEQVSGQFELRMGSLSDLIDATDMSLKRNQIGWDVSILKTGEIVATSTPFVVTASSTAATTTEREVKGVELKIDKITDKDGDGLSDLRESALGTDKKNPDTDGDGYLDGEEVANGYNPLGPGKVLPKVLVGENSVIEDVDATDE